MQSSLLILILWVWFTNAGRVFERNVFQDQPKVKLYGGSIINGVVDRDYASVRQFLGIPYAQPPVGDLRWEAPQTISLPNSVDAITYGRPCTQFLTTVPNVFNTDIFEFNVKNLNITGEDCLTLSVWTPEVAKNLPVVVFFYGGGWYTGGQDIPYQLPTQWIQRTKDLVVVVPK
jgi:cholinesterase